MPKRTEISADVLKYIKRKKWSYDDKTPTQYVIKICPFCGDQKKHFYVNKRTGQFLCWKCDTTGSLYELKKKLGDIHSVEPVISSSKPKLPKKKRIALNRKVIGWHNALKANKKVRRIIRDQWGWKSHAIEDFRLGVQRQGKRYWLVYPQYQNGKLVNVKYRTLPPAQKKFKRTTGGDSILYNIDNLDLNLNYVILVEGESDTITAHSYLRLKNVLGITVGARGFKAEWKDILDRFETIYLVYDNDIVGQKGAEKIAKRLGYGRCRNVLIPQPEDSSSRVDLTDWWNSGNNKSDFKKLLDQAEPFDVRDIISFSKVLDSIETDLFFNKNLDSQGLKTPWDKVTRMLGGFMPGDLIVLSAPAKTGKTTFALNLLTTYAMEGIPSLMYELEMRPERTGSKIISYFRGISRNQIQREDVIFVKTIFGRKPFYLAHSYDISVEQVFDTMREAVPRYGIEVLCFDHLHFLIRSVTNTAHEVSVTTRDFKLLAEELQIPIILIAQPRKIPGKSQRMTYNDLKDSSSIGQDADTVIILYRERIPVQDTTERKEESKLFKDECEVIVDATRWNPGGMAKLQFNGEIGRFFDNKTEERKFLHGNRHI